MTTQQRALHETSESAWRVFMCTLTRREVLQVWGYVALSLLSALAGSLVALLFVPLVQPAHAVTLGRVAFDVHGSVEAKATAFAIMMGAFALLRWQAAHVGARLVGRYGMSLRREVHARLLGAPLEALMDATSAEIANVLTHNVEIATQGFSAVLQIVVAGVTTVVSMALAFWMSPSLLYAAPVLVLFGWIAARAYGREQTRVSKQYVADMTRLFWLSEDFPRRLRHVRSFQREEAEKAGYSVISSRLENGYRRQLELVASGRLMLEMLAAISIAGVFVLAGHGRSVDQGALIAACLLLGRLLPYVISTRQSLQQWRAAIPALELWQRYMHLGTNLLSTAGLGSGASADTVRILRVRLKPPLPALEIGELQMVPGEMMLISGDSGIGKSSLMDVLAGMVEPASFDARVGVRPIGFDAYCERVRHGAYVSQQVRPWQRTVRECLSWADPKADDEQLWSVLSDVGLARRLRASDLGLDTSLTDSTSCLSGGELQRLLLAQVILRRPFIALLDEATNALDAASEIAVLSTMKRRLPGTIMVVVSHRAGVVAVADRLVDVRSVRPTSDSEKAVA